MFKKIFISLIIYLIILFIFLYFFEYYYYLEESIHNNYIVITNIHTKFTHYIKLNNFYYQYPYIGFKIHNIFLIKKLFFDKKILDIIAIILLFSSLWLFYIYKIIKKEENIKCFFKQANLETLATHNSMQILTENIHHELNTPLIILERNCKKLKELTICFYSQMYLGEKIKDSKTFFNEMKKRGIKEIEFLKTKKSLKQLEEVFELSNISIEQIKGVLNNMSDFKKLKYSNGNKTIYDLIEGAYKILKVIINHNYELKIDENFKKYSINHSTGLKNADLVNILLNHFKNSIEANSTVIEVKIDYFKNNFLYFTIKNNGAVINKELRKQIFLPNTTSKTHELGIRGNGLFVSLKLLQEYGGDIKLKYSDKAKGTAFLLKVPAILIQ